MMATEFADDVHIRVNAAGSTGRRSNALLLAVMVFLLSIATDIRVLPTDSARGQDFNAFYIAALAQRSGLNPYDRTVISRIELRQFHAVSFSTVLVNPPAFFIVLRPLTYLTAARAYVVWLVLALGALLLLVVLLLRSLVLRPSALTLMLALSPPTIIALFLGQIDVLIASVYVCAVVAILAHRPYVAGACLALTLAKPHLMLVPIAVLCALSWRQSGKRTLLTCATAAVSILLVSNVITGPEATKEWIKSLLSFGSTFDSTQPDISSIAGVYLAYVPSTIGRILSVTALVAGLAAIVALVARTVKRETSVGAHRWWTVLGLSISIWLAVLPYEHPYDAILLLVPLYVLLRESQSSALQGMALLAVVSMLALPQLDLAGFRPNFTFSYTLVPILATAIALSGSLVGQQRSLERWRSSTK